MYAYHAVSYLFVTANVFSTVLGPWLSQGPVSRTQKVLFSLFLLSQSSCTRSNEGRLYRVNIIENMGLGHIMIFYSNGDIDLTSLHPSPTSSSLTSFHG
ncbi:hypothetical protein F5B20DRAFT_286703 [Whalleya microplaca]|nr:hypothetical protein F5B20DRAFT_286703 [Whalleya microplaca]